jgi:hypothetical protein
MSYERKFVTHFLFASNLQAECGFIWLFLTSFIFQKKFEKFSR